MAQPTRGRGRPKAAAVATIDKAVISAAADVFLAEGFENASMEAIAARAKVTKVTLYKRYPDKRTLLRALLKERIPEWLSPTPTSADLESRLKYYAEAILVRGTSTEVRKFHMLAVSAWARPADMPAREEVLGYSTMLALLQEEIRAGAASLDIKPQNASLVATALMAMLSGWFDHAGASPDAAEAAAFSRRAVELVIYGKAAW